MKARSFLSQLSHDHVVTAIRQAERKTSGEIRVFVTREEINDPVEAAKKHFIAMGMHNTKNHNGVLFFVAPRSHNFAVIGDKAIHARCGEEFWTRVTAEMSGYFRQSKFTEGIIHGIKMAEALLSEHFPHEAGDKNELSDDIASD